MSAFDHVIGTQGELRALYREPSALVKAKAIAQLDEPTTRFVGRSTFVLVATTSATDGTADVSPRGGPPGFVKVVDSHRLVIPDLNGNNRLDTLANIIDSPQVGLLFLIPGNGETVRVNGRAVVTTDDAILDLFTDEFRRPTTAIGVEVEEVFLHCAKSIRRAGLWAPETWQHDAASAGEILVSALGPDVGFSSADIDRGLEASYVADLEADRPEA
jgi:uncharacterized protein